MQTFVNVFLGFFIFKSVVAAPISDTIIYDSEFYDIPLGELPHPFAYDENKQSDQVEIKKGSVTEKPIIKERIPGSSRRKLQQGNVTTDIGTKLQSVIQESYSSAPLTEETEDEASTPKLIDGSSAQGSGVLGPQTQDGLPTCFLCTCLGTTVYCDDRELHAVPPLPMKTTYFYSRYNRIKKISRNDFANLNHLKRIDLTANFISDIHKDAFRRLPQLQELVLRDNRIRQLPELPSTLTFIDVSKNRLGRRGIPNEAFKNLDELQHLYITDNNLDHIPLPLPESLQALHLQNNNIQELHEDTFCKRRDFTYVRRALEDIRLDGNPINLSKTPYAYMCLPRLPVGNLI